MATKHLMLSDLHFSHKLWQKENQKDYESFMEKYKDDELTNGIKFYSVETIEEVFELVFEE